MEVSLCHEHDMMWDKLVWSTAGGYVTTKQCSNCRKAVVAAAGRGSGFSNSATGVGPKQCSRLRGRVSGKQCRGGCGSSTKTKTPATQPGSLTQERCLFPGKVLFDTVLVEP